MLDPVSLFTFESHVDRRTVRASTLIVTVGTADPGHVQQIFSRHILDSLPNHRLGAVDTDQVHDYTAQRPVVDFEHDHFSDYQSPEIVLHQVTDTEGRDFLLLDGPEPSLQWERLTKTVTWLVDQFDVSNTILVHGVPAPTPHTRPTFISRFAGQPNQVPGDEALPVAIRMGATFTSLLSLRLGEQGHTVTGLVAHLPHYLTESPIPAAVLALLPRIEEYGRIALPLGDLPAAAETANHQLAAQLAESDEAQHMVRQFEAQYDRFIGHRLTQSTQVPTADEIGAEVEAFLRGEMGGDTNDMGGDTDQ